MQAPALHRFEHAGKRYVIDPESCFCFECDAISWDVVALYPHTPANRILHLLAEKHNRRELEEVLGELSWLRAAKSILQPPDLKETYTGLTREASLQRLVLFQPDAAMLSAGAHLLLARAQETQDLTLELRWNGTLPAHRDALATAARDALRLAGLAGRRLTLVARVDAIPLAKADRAFEGHSFAVAVDLGKEEEIAGRLDRLHKSGLNHLGRLAKALHDPAPIGRIIVQPGHANYAATVPALDTAGFGIIEVDLDSAFAANPQLDPSAMLATLRDVALYYAQRLLKHHYFRLDPIADLFWRIYNGTPIQRHDTAGTALMAVAADGGLYPAPAYVGRLPFRLGGLQDPTLRAEVRGPFLDLGVPTTPACMRCWARALCGGGTASTHLALGGAMQPPHAAWCDAQRTWLQTAIAAFSLLSSEGVQFARVYQNLTPQPRPSLWALAKAAFSLQIGMRPLGEADAPLLAKWEAWSEAAYFTYTESGLLMATQYDREMDALHPRPFEHEFFLLRRDGTPMGLLRLRPESSPGSAKLWIYLRDPAGYASEAVRKSFRFLLEEAATKQSIRRLIVPVGPREDALATFLLATGFALEGTQREALYLHGKYEDVRHYGRAL
jgi:uncharacterized protein